MKSTFNETIKVVGTAEFRVNEDFRNQFLKSYRVLATRETESDRLNVMPGTLGRP